MRQSEARDLRSFLAEPVEEVILEDVRVAENTKAWENVGARFMMLGAEERFTGPLRGVENAPTRPINPPATAPNIPITPNPLVASGAQSGLNPLRPSRLQQYRSQGVYVAQGTRGGHRSSSSGRQGSRQTQARATADLAPMPHKLVSIEPSPTLRRWERSDIYMWLVLFLLFLLVVLGGIGLDSLIANYH